MSLTGQPIRISKRADKVLLIDALWIRLMLLSVEKTWIGSRIGSQSTNRIRLIDTRNFACNAKIKSAWHNGAQTALGGFFFCRKTPCSYFHGSVQRGVLCGATMDEGRREVRILHKSVIIIIYFFFFISSHMLLFLYCILFSARERRGKWGVGLF